MPLSQIVSTVVSLFSAVWFTIVVHEYSHYLAGRMLNIPKNKLKVQLDGNPPHVALYDKEWLSPDSENYISTFRKYRKETYAAWIFIAAGTAGESIAILLLLLGLIWFNAGAIGLIFLATSTTILLIYLLAEGFMKLKYSRSYGDFAAMYAIYPLLTCILLLTVLSLRFFGIYQLLGHL
ncbi:hypothetical protein [Gracilibacillus phocaeensis]|uniref:hypothetical protein n=1 Tax=Gracilibacillus phocaeensis TaxID=2042304 RepID=UPI0010310F96|nr:hypothetical protein [Gracilibacillus phocaeensis]